MINSNKAIPNKEQGVFGKRVGLDTAVNLD
jgi:hypothetical protein